MEGLRATVGTRNLLFATTGDLVDVSGAAPQVSGQWTAASGDRSNTIAYQIDGGSAALPALYRFTPRNQLQVSVVVDGVETSPFTFPGRIEVDSHHNFRYFVVDAAGNDAGGCFVLYGDLSFAENTVNLTLTLAGGGVTTITGASGIQSLEAVKNHAAGFDADDLLTFHAKTVNVFDGVADPVTKPAILDFVGSWDVQDGTLVFLSQVKSSPAGEEVSLGFGGKFKAVTAGFVYFAGATGTKAVLNLRGRHVFKGGNTELSWSTTIGFSERSFDAQVVVQSFIPLPSGQGFTVDGRLALKGDRNKTFTFDLSLQARYQFEGGFLVFKADIANGVHPSYDLMLEGSFKNANLNLTFQINYSNSAAAQRLVVGVGVPGSRDSMIKNVALMLDISESQAKLTLDLTFEAKMTFKNGVRVKELPPPAAPPAGPV